MLQEFLGNFQTFLNAFITSSLESMRIRRREGSSCLLRKSVITFVTHKYSALPINTSQAVTAALSISKLFPVVEMLGKAKDLFLFGKFKEISFFNSLKFTLFKPVGGNVGVGF
jgi:hypothetical protein